MTTTDAQPNGTPVPIPVLGAVLETKYDDCRIEGDRARLRIGRILAEVSRRYHGAWVPLEPSIGGVVTVRHALIRVEAIPSGCPEVERWPVLNRSGRLDVEQLRPGLVVRIGLDASGNLRRSYFFEITEVGDQFPDGRIWLTGNRQTYAGRPVDHKSICVPIDAVYAERMT